MAEAAAAEVVKAKSDQVVVAPDDRTWEAGSTTCSDLAFAASAAAASAFVLSSSSFEANNCSTDRPASDAPKAKSACVVRA